MLPGARIKRLRIKKKLKRFRSRVIRLNTSTRLRLAYKYSPVYMPILEGNSATWTSDVREFLAPLGFSTSTNASEEFRQIVSKLSGSSSRTWPEFFDLGAESSEALFHLVRSLKPEIVLETGVANGLSSAMVLTAMDLNGTGQLHSVDVSRDVGQIFGKSHARWHLHVTQGSPRELERIMQDLGSVDLFIHDADHTYKSQWAEFVIAKKYLKEGGILFSDDIDSSWAFRDFCRQEETDMHILRGRSKLFGATRPH